MKALLLVGLVASCLVGLVAAHLGDWRTYAEAFGVLAGCAAELVGRYDFGRDKRF